MYIHTMPSSDIRINSSLFSFMIKYSNGDDDIILDLYNNSPLVLFHI